LGYSGGRQSTIDVTNLIWKGASIRSFLLFTQTEAAWIECWTVISELLKSGEIRPIIARQFALKDAAEAIRYLIEKRPFGRVLLAL
jgi:NADPH2:quinone reductase